MGQRWRSRSAGLLALVMLLLGSSPLWAAPAPKPETTTTDALDRIKLENVAGLLKSETIQKDVALTDEQKKKVEELKAEAAEKMRNELQARLRVALPPGAAGGGIAIAPGNIAGFGGLNLAANNAELDKAIAAQLKPEQVRRLKQITLQATGPQMLLDRRVIRALGLSAEQEDQIDAVLTKENKDEPIMLQPGPQLQEQLAEKRAEAVNKMTAEALKVLNKDQRATWEKLVGKMLPTKELMLAQPPSNLLRTWMGGQPGAMPAIRIAPQPGVALPALPIAPPPPK